MTGTPTTAARHSAPGPRRGLRRSDAAAYVGVSPSKFNQLVADGRMPQPLKIDGCTIWDIRKLDAAFDELAEGDANPFDAVVERLQAGRRQDQQGASAQRL